MTFASGADVVEQGKPNLRGASERIRTPVRAAIRPVTRPDLENLSLLGHHATEHSLCCMPRSPAHRLHDDDLLPMGCNILVVDDVPANLVAIEAALEPLAQRIVTVASGTGALGKLLEGDFALILLDVQMPGMDGYETARWIHSRDKTRRRARHRRCYGRRVMTGTRRCAAWPRFAGPRPFRHRAAGAILAAGRGRRVSARIERARSQHRDGIACPVPVTSRWTARAPCRTSAR
jgi:hypothetical protein